MASMNVVNLIGNLTRDVEIRTAGSSRVCELGLAINERRKNNAGQWVAKTIFVDVTCWGYQADYAAKYLRKGSPIVVEGRLELDSWEQNGQKRTKLKVVATNIQGLGSRSDSGASSPQPAAAPPPPAARPANAPERQREPGEDEDVPF